MGSKFYLHVNSADSPSAAPVFADKPTALDVTLPDQHSGPHFADWDGDGDLDLLSGINRIRLGVSAKVTDGVAELIVSLCD